MNSLSAIRRNQILKTVFLCILAVAVAFSSMVYLTPLTVNDENHTAELTYLDQKKAQVLELAGLSTVASVVISLLPGDAASPIAEQLAELSDYFLIVLAAIYIEKFLVSIIGNVSFYWLIPIACLLFTIYFIRRNETFKHAAIKMIFFAVAIYFVIPAAVRLDQVIENRNSATIQTAIENTRVTIENAPEEVLEIVEEQVEDNNSVLGWFQNRIDDVAETAVKIGDSMTAATQNGLDYAKGILNHFVDAVAIMIVTACVVPVLIVLAFIALTKIILGINIQPVAVSIANQGITNRRKMHSAVRRMTPLTKNDKFLE